MLWQIAIARIARMIMIHDQKTIKRQTLPLIELLSDILKKGHQDQLLAGCRGKRELDQKLVRKRENTFQPWQIQYFFV